MVKQGQKLHEGKAKIVYATNDPNLVIQHFKDDATAFNAVKRGTIQNKGVINNHISTILFQLLEQAGIPTHFVERISDRDMLIRRGAMLPLEVVMRNIVAGSLAKRLGRPEGDPVPRPILEYYLKNDALGDPMLCPEHIHAFNLVSAEALSTVDDLARRVNTFLQQYFAKLGILLVDFKLEFGECVGADGTSRIVVCDEITPDTCRLWDSETREKLDKDRFRFDLGKVEESYQRVYRLVCASVS